MKNIGKVLFATVAVTVAAFALYIFVDSLLGGNPKAFITPSPSSTDLAIGQTYEVADFQTCELPDGSKAYEFHFGGADRSRRNQLVPHLDGRDQRILRQSADIPAGMMRLRKVVEHHKDPTLEGFHYGTFVENWEGLAVEYNGPIQPQKVVRPCGPARS